MLPKQIGSVQALVAKELARIKALKATSSTTQSTHGPFVPNNEAGETGYVLARQDRACIVRQRCPTPSSLRRGPPSGCASRSAAILYGSVLHAKLTRAPSFVAQATIADALRAGLGL